MANALSFLVPDLLQSLSTLGAAIPAGKIQGMELGSQMTARDMEQRLRSLQALKEQMSLAAPKWSFHQGVAIPTFPTGQLGQPVMLPLAPKQFPPLKPKEQLEAEAIATLGNEEKAVLGKRLLAGQEKTPQTLQALMALYIDRGIPRDQWPVELQDLFTAHLQKSPHPVAVVLDKAANQGKQSLNPTEREIYNRAVRAGSQQQKNMDYNAKRWNLALRALGKPVADAEVQKLTPQEAQRALNTLKQDFLGGLLSGGLSGLPSGQPSDRQPKNAEDLLKMMDEENESSSE